MPKRITKKEILEHPKSAVRDIADDLDKAAALDALASSEGGVILLKSLVSDILSAIDTLTSKYNTLTNQEFVGICADIKTKIDIAKAIKRANANKKFLEDLLEKEIASE